MDAVLDLAKFVAVMWGVCFIGVLLWLAWETDADDEHDADWWLNIWSHDDEHPAT